MLSQTAIAALLAALGMDSMPRPIPGPQHRKTYYDRAPEMLAIGMKSMDIVKLHGPDFENYCIRLNRALGQPDSMVNEPNLKGIFRTSHPIAMAGGHPPIWSLDLDAFAALTLTEIPGELMREGLPRIPHPSILVSFPDGFYLSTNEFMGKDNKFTSVIVTEEIPGVKWRFIALEDEVRSGGVQAFDFGNFDIRKGPVMRQLPAYSERSHGVIWQMLFNLFLTLEHGYLGGRVISPTQGKGTKKIKRMERKGSTRDYFVINLTPTKHVQSESRESTATDRKSPVRHLVRGHWRTYWVKEPEDRVIIDTRDVEKGGQFKIAKYIPPFLRGGGAYDPRRTYEVVAPEWSYEE